MAGPALPALALLALGALGCGAVPQAISAATLHNLQAAGNLDDGRVSLLQHRLDADARRTRQSSSPAAGARTRSSPHYWPHARGRPHSYSQQAYSKMPSDLNKSLAWQWNAPHYNTILWGSLIDSKRNIYVAGVEGIWKFSPAGEELWHSNMGSEMPTLVGDTLVGMRMMDCLFFALSLETGELLWSKRVWAFAGAHGDFVEAHNGIAVVAVGSSFPTAGGSASTHVAGVSATNGSRLWEFEADCGLWNIMALFPDDETAVFNDMCGGVYRVFLQNGTRLWSVRGPQSFTDGGSMLGPDGSVYTCSNPANAFGQVSEPGVLRKYRLGDGTRLWEAMLPYPCVNFPAVSADGRSVVVAPGALAVEAKMKEAKQMPVEAHAAFYTQQELLLAANKQRSFYHQPDLEAAIMSFDAETGSLQWRHDVKPYGGVAFAGDEERAYMAIQQGHGMEHCWPAHWSAPTIDQDGAVYIGRSSGDLHVFNPRTGAESTFRTGDGILMAGASFAPGLMVFVTCSSVYAFDVPPA